MTRTYDIPKHLFIKAFKLVKANGGGAGVDKQSLEHFERDLKDIPNVVQKLAFP